MNKFIAPEELSYKFGKKKDLYAILSIDLGFFLPQIDRCPISFMKDLLSNKKSALLQKDVIAFPIPRYKELSAKTVWGYTKELPDLVAYFPDMNDSEPPDRAFLWGVLRTLRTDACKKLLEDARKVRSKDSEESKEECIEIHPEIYRQLLDTPNLTGGKGRVAYLLRKSNVERKERKKPKEFSSNLRLFSQHEVEKQRLEESKSEERKKYLREEENMNVDAQPPTITAETNSDHQDQNPSRFKWSRRENISQDERIEF